MPPSASRKMPRWRAVAPVKAPFSWPKSSLSMSASGMAPQLTTRNGLSARSRRVVDGARDALLARAALAGDEHGASRVVGDALRRGRRSGASPRSGRGARAARSRRDLRAQALVLGDDRALLERLVDEGAKLGGRERLGDEVVGAALHRVDRRLERRVRGHHDDLGPRRCAPWRATGRRCRSRRASARSRQDDGVRLGRVADRRRSPSRSRARASTSSPSRRKRIASMSRSPGSSSTTRMRLLLGPADILRESTLGRPPPQLQAGCQTVPSIAPGIDATVRPGVRLLALADRGLRLAGADADRDDLLEPLLGVHEQDRVRAGRDGVPELRRVADRLPVEDNR